MPDPERPTRRETVILIHGIWMHGIVMQPLARRVRQAGFEALNFSYPSLGSSVAASAARLDKWVRERRLSRTGVIAHSLGGLVLDAWLGMDPPVEVPRAVALGTPFLGSRVAHNIARLPLIRSVLGASREGVLVSGISRWPHATRLAVFAGDRGIGAGLLFGVGPGAHDGTVRVDETRVPGADLHSVFHTTHTGMLFSRDIAQAAARYLGDEG